MAKISASACRHRENVEMTHHHANHKRLLAAAELLHEVRLVALAGKGDLDADARVLLDALARLLGCRQLGLLRLRVVVLAALDHELRVAGRHELLEDVGEVLGHLLERAGDGLVLLRVKRLRKGWPSLQRSIIDLDEILDGRVGLVLLVLALDELLALLGEADVLVQRLLVDVAVVLELVGALAQHVVELLHVGALVLLKGLAGQRAQVADLLQILLLLDRHQPLLVQHLLHRLQRSSVNSISQRG